MYRPSSPLRAELFATGRVVHGPSYPVTPLHFRTFSVTPPGVEINTGAVARGQWICCRASEICNSLARLACKILKPNFWDYMV